MHSTLSGRLALRWGSLLCTALFLAFVPGCSKPLPPPPEVAAEFATLLETVDSERPGGSASRLTSFLARNEQYEIASEVEREIDRLRSLAKGRYHEARELARAGEFDRAEAVLEDLANHLPDTPDGESAKQHLEFDFHFGKAQWLMVRQRSAESAEVARLLIDRDLTRSQQEKVEMILDNASHVSAAYSQATRAQAQSACGHLVILLQMIAAEEGSFPPRLSLADVEKWDPMGSRSIRRSLSAIEDYQATDRSFSFTAVSAGNEHRIRVVDGEIQR